MTTGFLFFFQAEDGIRDRNVTGVQTCALPIYDCGFMRAQRLDRGIAVARADHIVAFVGPFELALQAFIILDDEEHPGWGGVGHAIFRSGWAAAPAAGRRIVKVVPRPRRLSTLRRPPIAVMSERASKAPMPKPAG